MSNSRFIVFSGYGENITDEVVRNQKSVVEKFLPVNWMFAQQLVKGIFNHPNALQSFVDSCNDEDIICLLDIDCIPLSKEAFPILAEDVLADNRKGLAGVIQRANHIQNNKHLYVGPSCMAFSKRYYRELRSPSFTETNRGDAGEELTYRWTEASGFISRQGDDYYRYPKNIHFIWPLSCLQPIWNLDYGFKFGFGTTYGTAVAGPLFYHQFCARDKTQKEYFINKCNDVLSRERVLK